MELTAEQKKEKVKDLRPIDDVFFPVLSEEVRQLKDTEGGAAAVCEVMKHYENIARKEGIQQGMQQGMQQGIQQEKRRSALAMLKEGLAPEIVARCLNLTVAEIAALQ